MTKSNQQSPTMTIRIPVVLRSQLEDLAKVNGMTLSGVIIDAARQRVGGIVSSSDSGSKSEDVEKLVSRIGYLEDKIGSLEKSNEAIVERMNTLINLLSAE